MIHTSLTLFVVLGLWGARLTAAHWPLRNHLENHVSLHPNGCLSLLFVGGENQQCPCSNSVALIIFQSKYSNSLSEFLLILSQTCGIQLSNLFILELYALHASQGRHGWITLKLRRWLATAALVVSRGGKQQRWFPLSLSGYAVGPEGLGLPKKKGSLAVFMCSHLWWLHVIVYKHKFLRTTASSNSHQIIILCFKMFQNMIPNWHTSHHNFWALATCLPMSPVSISESPSGTPMPGKVLSPPLGIATILFNGFLCEPQILYQHPQRYQKMSCHSNKSLPKQFLKSYVQINTAMVFLYIQ